MATLYQYNAKGELAYTAVDVNTNGVMDFNGTDRITFTTNWVEGLVGTWSGIDARIQQTYVWSTNSSAVSNLLATSYASTDGLRAWEVRWQTPTVYVTTAARTVYDGNNRYVTNTAPGGDYTISHYYNGRLMSVTAKDAGHDQLARTTYGYDSHGRQASSTDARTGTTVFTYNAADQVASVTTPHPGTPGGAPQTTEWHANAGLYYYGYRYYEPNLQRWLNRDPIEDIGSKAIADLSQIIYQFDNVASLFSANNLYLWNFNDGISYVDTDGRVVWFVPMIGGFVLGFAGDAIFQGLTKGWGCIDYGNSLASGALGSVGLSALGNAGKAAKLAYEMNKLNKAKHLIPTGMKEYTKHQMKQESKMAIKKGVAGAGAKLVGDAVLDIPKTPAKDCE